MTFVTIYYNDCISFINDVCDDCLYIFRFTFLSEKSKPHLLEWDSLMTNFVLEGHESQGETLVNHVLEMPVQTVQNQVQLLGSISNYHWWASLDIYGRLKSSKNQPKYQQHLLFYPGPRKALPSSPRNLLMYFAPHIRTMRMPDERFCTPHQKQLILNIMNLVKYDQEIEVTILHQKVQPPPPSPPPTNDNEVLGTPLKKRRYAFREVSANPEDLLEGSNHASGGGLEAVQSSVPKRTMFTSFSEELHRKDGIVQWRMHLEDMDVVVLNDYNPTSGMLKPLDFVHVTASGTDSDHVQIQCTCRIYQYMHGKALRKAHMEDATDTVLASNFTCMHCRFYSTYLLPFQGLFNSQECVNKLHEKVRQTEREVNAPVVLMGEANPSTTTKLSVAAGNSVAMVHIHFTLSACFAKCQDGMCQTLHSTKRRVPVGISLRDVPKGQMCEHLHTLFHNQDVLDDLFPEFFKPADQTPGASEQSDDIPADVPDPEPINQDDAGIRNKISSYISFNVSEGKWESSSHSHFQPRMTRHDPDLVKHTHTRLMYSAGPLTPQGFQTGPLLSPDMTPPDGHTEKLCPVPGCGGKFDTLVERTVLVYTRQVCTIVMLSNTIVLTIVIYLVPSSCQSSCYLIQSS